MKVILLYGCHLQYYLTEDVCLSVFPSGFHLVSVHLFAYMDYALCLRYIIGSKFHNLVYVLATFLNTYQAKGSCLITNKLAKSRKKKMSNESLHIFGCAFSQKDFEMTFPEVTTPHFYSGIDL